MSGHGSCTTATPGPSDLIGLAPDNGSCRIEARPRGVAAVPRYRVGGAGLIVFVAVEYQRGGSVREPAERTGLDEAGVARQGASTPAPFNLDIRSKPSPE